MKMKLILSTVTFCNVLSLGYCLGNLLDSQVTLAVNTHTSRVFVCVCTDTTRCTAGNWKSLLAECRQKAGNVSTEIVLQETTPATSSNSGSGISSCDGVPNGDYASSFSCKEYITCANENMFRRTCFSGTGWDDAIKTCVYLPIPTCP